MANGKRGTVVELWSYGRAVGRLEGGWRGVWNCERLPNAHAKLRRRHTGLHRRVRYEVLQYPAARSMLYDAYHTILKDMAQYAGSTLRYGFGCHAGVHRSVSVVEDLARQLSKVVKVRTVHRDLYRRRADRRRVVPRR